MVDQDEESPAEGWPAWMDRQIRESDFVLAVCTAIYRQRTEEPEQSSEGRGAAWEGGLIREFLYFDKTVNTKFIPLLLECAIAR